jgi:hypothetical protein
LLVLRSWSNKAVDAADSGVLLFGSGLEGRQRESTSGGVLGNATALVRSHFQGRVCSRCVPLGLATPPF